MHAWETIEHSLDYIDEHLGEEVKIEELAGMAALSPFYFQRLFKRLVHKPVQEYVKLRRLAKAVEALRDPSRRILDVALDYGFSSHANFTRAFKDAYTITPEEYRKALPMLNTFDRPEVAANYVLISEGVPLVVGDIVLELERKSLTAPESYIGFETAVSIAAQTPVGESTGVDVPGQLWRQYHTERNATSPGIHTGVELGMSHSADPKLGTFRFASELKVMSVLWRDGDVPAKHIAKLLTEELGWNVNTTYTLIKRCIKKGAIERSEPGFMCHALVPQAEVQEAETNELIDRVYDGSADKLFAALLGRKKLSAEQIEKLKQIVGDLE